MKTTVSQRLAGLALERGLRQSTVLGYERLFRRLGMLDAPLDSITMEQAVEALWTIDNPNTRRSAVIALRSVFGWNIKIPKAIPRRYELPDEDSLRFALMLSPHEPRGLLMMYAGLRIGEACAVTASSRQGDRLTVDKQVLELHRKGSPTTWRLAPVKTNEAAIVVPHFMETVIDSLQETAKPGRVRESLRRAGTKVGIDLTPHMLRHWYATTMLARGIPLSLVSKQMRHSDVSVTLRTYSQHNDGDIHRAFPTERGI